MALGMTLMLSLLMAPPTSAQEADPLVPEYNCIEYLGDGVVSVWFGYDNPTGETIEVEIGEPDNYFEGFSEDRGQPAEFEPGQHEQVFAVNTFSADDLTWHLLGESVSGPEGLEGQGCDIEEPTLEMTGPSEAELGDSFDYEVTVQTEGYMGDLTVVISVPSLLEIDDVDFDELLGWENEPVSDCTIDEDANEVTCEYFSGHPLEGQYSEEFNATVSVTVTGEQCGTITGDAALSGEEMVEPGFYGLDDPIDTASVDTELIGCTADLTVSKEVEGDAPDDATFDFELMCESLTESETFVLADGQSTTLEVQPGQECTLLEFDRGDAEATTYAIDGGDATDGAEVTFDISEDGTAVHFVNTFETEVTDVADEEEDEDVLPETGIAPLGLLALGAGAAFVGARMTRRRD